MFIRLCPLRSGARLRFERDEEQPESGDAGTWDYGA